MSDAERRKAAILLVEPDPALRQSLRQHLVSLGYGSLADASDHLQALKKLGERRFTHIIFEAKKTTMPAKDFMLKAFEMDDNMIAIPSSWDPNVDDVFGLLIIGARGYLVKPTSQDNLDESIVMASKGEPISESVLYAKNRNEALAMLIVGALDRLTIAMRQALQFETAKREIPGRMSGFKRAVEIGKTFADGGESAMLEELVNVLIERGEGPASRLGRVRKRIEAKKQALIKSPGDAKKISKEEITSEQPLAVSAD